MNRLNIITIKRFLVTADTEDTADTITTITTVSYPFSYYYIISRRAQQCIELNPAFITYLNLNWLK